MLDLSAISRFYELKWFDGHVIHLRKPSEGFLRKIQSLAEIEDNIEGLEELRRIVQGMIRDNEDGRVFSDEELAKLDLDLCLAIIKDYMKTVDDRLGE